MIIKLRLIRIGLTSLGFALKQTHSLSLLIILEAIILRLLLFLFRYLIGVGALSWFLVILTFAACEAALGLSLLVRILRLRGNDFISTLRANHFFSFS